MLWTTDSEKVKDNSERNVSRPVVENINNFINQAILDEFRLRDRH